MTVRSAVANYQAWAQPQCGQPTDVVTGAVKTKPQPQVYSAASCGEVGALVAFARGGDRRLDGVRAARGAGASEA